MSLARVVLIEDDAFIRTMLSTALEAAGFEVLASGAKAIVALEAQKKSRVDVAILDLDLGAGPNGLDIALALRAADSSVGIVLLTSFSDPRLSSAQDVTLPEGTRYLTKSNLGNINQLFTAVLQAKYHPRSRSAQDESTRVELTSQQIEVLKLLAAGSTNAQIARLQSVSEKAVEHMISRMNDALDIDRSANTNSRVQLVRKFSSLTGRNLPEA